MDFSGKKIVVDFPIIFESHAKIRGYRSGLRDILPGSKLHPQLGSAKVASRSIDSDRRAPALSVFAGDQLILLLQQNYGLED